MSAARAGTPGRRTWPQRLLITFNVFLIVTCLVIAGGLGYFNYKFGRLPRVAIDPTVLTETEEPGVPQNFLVVGTDDAARLDPNDPVTNGRQDLGVLSDTIMVLRVDPGETKAQLLSLPRDLWLPIAGGGEQRINTALSVGGPEALIQTINDYFGIEINHYLQMDFFGFKELVSAVDGIPMYFEHPVRDEKTGLSVTAAGCITLSPEQALAYARSRSFEFQDESGWHTDGTGDLGRISRQQDFIRRAIQRAVVKGIRNPVTLNQLIDVGIGNVTVDDTLTAQDIFTLGKRFRTFEPTELETHSLDVYDDLINGAQVLRMSDTDDNQATLDIFRGVAIGGDDPASVQVQVLNGSGTSGQAGTVADELSGAGFTVIGTGDAERFDFANTVVRYTPGNEVAADVVQRYLAAGALLEEVPDLPAPVVLVTGLDYVGLNAEPAPSQLTTTTTAPPAEVPGATTTTTAVIGEVPGPPPDGQQCG
ncbi:MAG: LCP family protein [Acidimicrobiales bacterium]|nr:LCP family protein [Acidimicrobiales bacterium]MCB1016632.1 LCP family protein [Acidimicrobiales bacterium]